MRHHVHRKYLVTSACKGCATSILKRYMAYEYDSREYQLTIGDIKVDPGQNITQ